MMDFGDNIVTDIGYEVPKGANPESNLSLIQPVIFCLSPILNRERKIEKTSIFKQKVIVYASRVIASLIMTKEGISYASLGAKGR